MRKTFFTVISLAVIGFSLYSVFVIYKMYMISHERNIAVLIVFNPSLDKQYPHILQAYDERAALVRHHAREVLHHLRGLAEHGAVDALLHEARGSQLVYLDDLGGFDEDDDYLERHCATAGGDPGDWLRDKRFRHALVGAIEELPERERLLMTVLRTVSQPARNRCGDGDHRVARLPAAQSGRGRLRSKLKNW